MEEMRRKGFQVQEASYFQLLIALCKKDRLLAAESTLKEMLQRHPTARTKGCTVLVDAYAKANDLERAEHWMRCISGATVVSYGAVLDACAKRPDALKALQWHERMLEQGLEPPRAAEKPFFRRLFQAFPWFSRWF